jgi:hypothetical protein
LCFLSLHTLLVAVLSATTGGKVDQVVAMASKCRVRPRGWFHFPNNGFRTIESNPMF